MKINKTRTSVVLMFLFIIRYVILFILLFNVNNKRSDNTIKQNNIIYEHSTRIYLIKKLFVIMWKTKTS